MGLSARQSAPAITFTFFNKAPFDSLCIVIVERFRGGRKFSVDLECSNTRIDSRQGAKYAKFGTERLIILQTILFIFSDLCGLGVFAGDIPSFGCGSAALCE
jgi:hypothetical protein